MVPVVPLTNLAMYAVGIVSLWIVVPHPPGNRLYLFRVMFDTYGVGRLGARLAGTAFVVGAIVPAALGLVPIQRLSPTVGTSLAGILYLPFLLVGAWFVPVTVGAFRLRRRLARSTETDLHAPPTEGPALVSATVRAPDGDDSGDDPGDEYLVHDYRNDMLIRVGIWEECESLKRVDPFVLEGPAGSIDVDGTGAHVAMFENDVEDRRFADGDEITVLGTVRADQHGGFSMSGSEDFLYLTGQTPSEFRSRIRKNSILVVLFVTVGLLVAGWSLNALVGFA